MQVRARLKFKHVVIAAQAYISMRVFCRTDGAFKCSSTKHVREVRSADRSSAVSHPARDSDTLNDEGILFGQPVQSIGLDINRF